jgi:hypothetical protein
MKAKITKRKGLELALELKSWHLASGIWHLASGIWHLASGIWHLASGTWQKAKAKKKTSPVNPVSVI